MAPDQWSGAISRVMVFTLQLPLLQRPQPQWRRPWGCCPWFPRIFGRSHVFLFDSQNRCRTMVFPHGCCPPVSTQYHVFLPVFKKMWTRCGQERGAFRPLILRFSFPTHGRGSPLFSFSTFGKSSPLFSFPTLSGRQGLSSFQLAFSSWETRSPICRTTTFRNLTSSSRSSTRERGTSCS